MHHVEVGDPLVSNSIRCETSTYNISSLPLIEDGQDRFYGFSLFLPSDYYYDFEPDIIFQWKGFGTEPYCMLQTKQGDLVFRYNYDATGSGDPNNATKDQVIISPAENEIWHDFIFHFKWDYDLVDDGLIEIWYKSQSSTTYSKIFTRNGPNMYNNNGYLKWGIYKPSFINGATSINSRTIYHDNILVGFSFDEVNPESPRLTSSSNSSITNTPKTYSLHQNYPNPFNPSTNINYSLPIESDVTISVYDMLGRIVNQLISSKQPSGNHSIEWNGNNIYGNPVGTGIYFYQIQAGDFVQTKKMVLMR